MSNPVYSQEALAVWHGEPTQMNFEKLVATISECRSADKISAVTFAAGAESTLVCVFSGRMDAANASEFERCLIDLVKCLEVNVTFDIEHVSFIASAFLRICLEVAKLCGEGGFRLINPCPNCRKVLMIAGLDKLFIRG